jgi:hypothetical protein
VFYFSVGGRKFQHCATGNLVFFFCSCPISIQGWLFHFIFKYVFFCEREVRVSIIFCAFPFGWWNFSTAENRVEYLSTYTHSAHTLIWKREGHRTRPRPFGIRPKNKIKTRKIDQTKIFLSWIFFPILLFVQLDKSISYSI